MQVKAASPAGRWNPRAFMRRQETDLAEGLRQGRIGLQALWGGEKTREEMPARWLYTYSAKEKVITHSYFFYFFVSGQASSVNDVQGIILHKPTKI